MTQTMVPEEDVELRRAIRKAIQPLMIATAIFLGVALALGGVGFVVVESQQRDIVTAREEARTAQCYRDNVTRHDAIDAGKAKAADLVDTSDRENKKKGLPPTSPEVRKAFIESQGAAAASAYPRRDCTDHGIDLYYENPPQNPDEGPCKDMGDGLCKDTQP